MRNVPIEEQYSIDVDYSPEDEAFVAVVPDMPYMGAHGDTEEEAWYSAKEAIRAYEEVAAKRGKPLPEPKAVV